MLVWVTLIAGIGICLLGSLAVVRVDRRWRRRHQRCGRCRATWFGEGKLCDGCGARGHDYDRLATVPQQRRPVDYTDPVWSAPVTAPEAARPGRPGRGWHR